MAKIKNDGQEGTKEIPWKLKTPLVGKVGSTTGTSPKEQPHENIVIISVK